MPLEVIGSRLTDAVSSVLGNFVNGFADLLVILIFLGLGLFVAKILVHVLEHFLEQIQLEKSLKKRKIDDALLGFTLTDVLGKFVKIMTVAVFLGIAAEVVQLTFLGSMITWFISYVPSLLQGATILVLALLFADYISDRIHDSKMPFSSFLGTAFEVLVVYVALVMALPAIFPNVKVGVLEGILNMVLGLGLGAIAVAIGLGFAIAIGLGMKDSIARVAKKREKDFERIF
ncbi:MAG: hypothetical protein V1834_03335 [Candidatus Micrarchaeota archaeon]